VPADALRLIAADPPDVVVLDLGLPDLDGKDVIARVRAWSDVPIAVLSAREREGERIAALDLGADDLVNKPFGVGELMARLRAAQRHRMQRSGETPIVRVGGLEIDVARRRVTRDGQELNLTRREFELLSILARHAGKIVTHKQILHTVGARPRAGHTVSADLYRAALAKGGAGSVRFVGGPDRNWDWVSARGADRVREPVTLP